MRKQYGHHRVSLVVPNALDDVWHELNKTCTGYPQVKVRSRSDKVMSGHVAYHLIALTRQAPWHYLFLVIGIL